MLMIFRCDLIYLFPYLFFLFRLWGSCDFVQSFCFEDSWPLVAAAGLQRHTSRKTRLYNPWDSDSGNRRIEHFREGRVKLLLFFRDMVCQSQDSTTGGRDIKKRPAKQHATNSHFTVVVGKACRAQNPPSFSPPNADLTEIFEPFHYLSFAAAMRLPIRLANLAISMGDWANERWWWRRNGKRKLAEFHFWLGPRPPFAWHTVSADLWRNSNPGLHSWDSQVQKHVKIVMLVPGFCVSTGISKYQTIIYL